MARPLFSVCKRRYSFSRSYHTVRTPPAPRCVVKREQVTGCKYPWPRRSCARPAPVASARLLFNLVATLASRARRFQLAPGAPGGHANVLPRASARRNLRTAVVVATSAT